MNWRLKFLSVLILGCFAAFAWLYYKYFVAPKPAAIILFIVPGLNLDNIAGTNDRNLNLLYRSARFAVVNNDDLSPPFQAHPNAILSYFATGYKTFADRLGLSTDGRVQDNLLYMAQRAGRTVGLVGTGSVTAPELAVFYAHTLAPDNVSDVLPQLLDNTKINVILSGGGDDFTQVKQTTGRDLLREAGQHGYTIIHTNSELQDAPAWRPPWRANRILGIFAGQQLPPGEPLMDESGPTLTDLVRRAIQCLELNLNGYFLVVHNGQVARAILSGDSAQVSIEIKQLDHALSEARSYAGEDAVIVLYSPYNVPTVSGAPVDRSFGWLSIYTENNDDPIRGFATGKQLYRYLRQQLRYP